MKSLKYFIIGLGLLSFTGILQAQLATSTISPGSAEPAQTESIVQFTAEAYGLSQIAPAELPVDGGAYWFVTPEGIMAPLPASLFDLSLPIYALADNIFLVDGTGGQIAVTPDQTRGCRS